MKILINEKEKIIFNDEEITESMLNSEFLERIVQEGLNDTLDIEIECDETMPLAKLFLDIKSMVDKDSEFRKELKEIDAEQKKLEEQLKNDDENIDMLSDLD